MLKEDKHIKVRDFIKDRIDQDVEVMNFQTMNCQQVYILRHFREHHSKNGAKLMNSPMDIMEMKNIMIGMAVTPVENEDTNGKMTGVV